MLSYFGLREWKFQNSNIKRLSMLLKSKQRSLEQDANEIINENGSFRRSPVLEFDMQTINWNEYFFNYLPGIKKYFLKEKLTENGKCKKNYAR